MPVMLSAKGGDFTAWRAAEDFAAAYRRTLLDLAAADLSARTEAVFTETCAALEAAIATHRKLVKHLDSLMNSVATEYPAADLNGVTESFYGSLYRHFARFRSTQIFYQLSMDFLKHVSAAIIAHAAGQLGSSARDLPEMALIALGPAGRGEYSPFCPLQLLLVHGEAAPPQLRTLDLFCTFLHTGFEKAGLAVDPVVTPRNERWRGTLTKWRQRCENRLRPQEVENVIDLGRLVDQYPLYADGEYARELKQISITALNGNRRVLASLMTRMTALSNGLGLMGRLKLDRSGPGRGMFRLLDHGLLPFSAALSALVLIKESLAVGNCDRVTDMLARRELDVDLAERMLMTWHTLNELRLDREQGIPLEKRPDQGSFLDPAELSAEQQHSLKSTLESVALIQRHVEIIYSGMGA